MIYKTVLNKKGQEENFAKIFTVKEDESVSLETLMEFKASNTKGNTIIKAVVMPRGKLYLKGSIKISPKVNLVEAFLKQNILLLGEDSTAVAIPELEIESNNVKASHAVTIGRIDKEQLFYIMSRGFSEKQAQKLIINAFLAE